MSIWGEFGWRSARRSSSRKHLRSGNMVIPGHHQQPFKVLGRLGQCKTVHHEHGLGHQVIARAPGVLL